MESSPQITEIFDSNLENKEKSLDIKEDSSNPELEDEAKSIDLKVKGNEHFKSGDYESAILSYTDALRYCPKDNTDLKVILYSNMAACKDHQEDNEDAINYCTEALTLNDKHLKALLRRAVLYRKTDKLDEALADYENYLKLVPDDRNVRRNIDELKLSINERNEKLKNEMMSKLKNLGNIVLKPFGLSTENFQVVKNEETGGYSVNFQNNN